MAHHLARIHGTEEDKVNCPFYFKIGACRHSDRCSRLHHKPQFSQTLLVKHLYQHPVRQAELQQAVGQPAAAIPEEQAVEEFFCFFEDMFMEFSKFGRIEEMHIVDNLGDHLIGHVYVKFSDEEDASDALAVMNGRYYDGRQMQVEFSPVTDFREARCRDYDDDVCARGGFCNFLHSKPVPMCLIRSLEEDAERERELEERDKKHKSKKRKKDHESRHHHRKRSRHSRSRSRDRSRSEDGRSSD
ncbi:splicing factor U2AF 35 kDa subunit [Fistulifera solaris]|uniref:Splicing factor U2AF 35 kDa subunit n=1 Tax=Fistulifera solaris TaxID=1519565 RepID=A0A1Z5KJN6_FISSO|nr:splicing factor U2AF 35 kDa subunit [Fistulifera solaris]|eukprot:GAX26158.1 splicing factor U2AF 35 kDa subunit [Fistulifera solaris]